MSTLDFVFTPAVKLSCSRHQNELISRGCIDLRCQKDPIYCPSCFNMNDKEYHKELHSKELKPIENLLFLLSEEIEKISKDNGFLFNQLINTNQNRNILKYKQDYSQHLKKVEDHLIVQKVMIAEDIANLMALFGEVCQNIKNELLSRLDEYFTEYKEKFEKFNNMVDDNFSVSQQFKYYSNPNNLLARAQNELPKDLPVFINTVKNGVTNANEILKSKTNFTMEINNLSRELNEMSCNLPCYLNSDSIESLLKRLSTQISSFFHQNLQIFKNSPPENIPEKLHKKSDSVEIEKENKAQNPVLKRQMTMPIEMSGHFQRKTNRLKSEKIFDSKAEVKIENPILENEFLKKAKMLNFNKKFNEDFNVVLANKYQFNYNISSTVFLDDNFIVFASNDEFLRLYDISKNEIALTIEAHSEQITLLDKIVVFYNDQQILKPNINIANLPKNSNENKVNYLYN